MRRGNQWLYCAMPTGKLNSFLRAAPEWNCISLNRFQSERESKATVTRWREIPSAWRAELLCKRPRDDERSAA
jgi:hypothetical protein